MKFILEGTQDFRHPVLMLQTARVLNSFFKFEHVDRLILLCRSISVFFAVLTVLFTYLLAREILDRKFALFSAFAVSVSPIMVIHAHYFKEDMIFTAFALLSLLCLIKYLQQPTLGRNILCGLATGLAFSAQYKAVLLGAFFFLIPFFLPQVDKRSFFKSIGIGFGVALVVFIAVNYPIFLHHEKFLEGVNHEAGHLFRGHRLKIHAIPQGFSFHLLNSIAPGISWGLTILALGGLGLSVWKWKETSSVEKIFFTYVAMFYFANEIIPLKPFPDFMRYMIPVVPLLMIFACRFIPLIVPWIQKAFRFRTPRSFGLPLMILFTMWPLYDSILLNHHLIQDTRIKSQEWVESSGKKVMYGRYTNIFQLNGDFRTILDVDIASAKKSGIEYLLVSSFVYDRYLKGGKLQGQNQKVYELNDKYNRLFSQPYIEIKPEYKSFAFSNPVIRIVDIRGWS